MRRPMLAGVLVAGLYLVSAAISGRLDVFARRPLLDGATPPPPYRWVSPPADLAGKNLKPTSARQSVPFVQGASEGEFVSTDDGQASIVLPKGAIPPRGDARAADFTIEPRDPARFRGYPRKLAARGNVYELRATYQGTGEPIGRMEPPARIIFAYPAHTPEFRQSTHMVLHSNDGRRWRTLPTDNDSPVALQIAISSPELGFFMVAAEPGQVPGQGGASPLIIVGGVVAVAGGAGFYAWRTARSRTTAARKARAPRSLPKKGGKKKRR